MSDTPTSVSLSKTPAARPAPITNTGADGRAQPRTQTRTRNVLYIRGDTMDEFLRTFLRRNARLRCYVKLDEKAGNARRAVAH